MDYKDVLKNTEGEKTIMSNNKKNSRIMKEEKVVFNPKWRMCIVEKSKIVPKKVKTVFNAYQNDGIKGVYNKFREYFERRIIKNRINRISKKEESAYLMQSHYENCIGYNSVYQEDMDFSEYSTDVKALAFYLPQFHTFPENDAWWGKGFTEWTNTRKGEPRFEGHYQPRTPHEDFGYYDLTDIEVMRKQAELARKHGIYGFCFYYYWFSGKRLMEKPVDQLLEHPEIDIPFCLCWANENWTRTWDGQSQNVLIKQDYSLEDRDLFIQDIYKYIADSRYIRIQGKPLIIVYNPSQIPERLAVFETWRRKAKEIGIGEILIWSCRTNGTTARLLGVESGVDAEVEFPPHNIYDWAIQIDGVNLRGKTAHLIDYRRLAVIEEDLLIRNKGKAGLPIHRCCTMGWDNAARRNDGWMTFCGYSLEYLYRWMKAMVINAREELEEEERFVFINAWNEWAEGTYLEPDEKYGYANINTISKALFDM